MDKVNIQEKLSQIQDHWNPHIAGELNGQHIKLAKIKGEFIWHKHAEEDEMFLVLDGEFQMHLRDTIVHLKKGEFFIVPRGVEHRPVASEEAAIMLFEPVSTINTGETIHDLTRNELKSI